MQATSTATVHKPTPDTSSKQAQRFAEVAVEGVLTGARNGVFTYEVPPDWDEPIAPGQLVWVPLRKQIALGLVVAETPEQPSFETRPLHAAVVPATQLTAQQLEMAHWLARETASAIFTCAALFLPAGITHEAVERFSLTVASDALPDDLTPAQQKLISFISKRGAVSLDDIRAVIGRSAKTLLDRLEARGLLSREVAVDQHVPRAQTRPFVRLLDNDPSATAGAPNQDAVREELVRLARFRRDGEPDLIGVADVQRQIDVNRTVLTAMAEKGIVELHDLPSQQAPVPRPMPAPVLTPEQAAAWSNIERALQKRDSTPHLLFGVTGSGKTEIYLRAVAWCLAHGRSAIVLVPEIGLATQIVRRFTDRFPGQVDVIHSQLSPSQRHEIWQDIADGVSRVVVGPRSALFTPAQNLGLIVIDEEHEGTYKQDSEPRYHARRVATELARQQGAALVLGSATPSIETAWSVEQGETRQLTLSARVAPRGSANGGHSSLALPSVEVVDLRLELQQGNLSLLSRALQSGVSTALGQGEQAILLLNRRGMSTVVLCRACGLRLTCPHCDIPLVFHKDQIQMICHRCNFHERPPDQCPDCPGRLDFFGAGTQRVEDEVRGLYPDARVMRWDQDSIRAHGGYAAMVDRVEQGHVDIVVGTQMVAKGFDLPKVTTIGVVQADSMLHLPDFRGAERTFQLLTQVAGRAGRRRPGSTVVVQTYTPQHYAIQAASHHDFAAFYAEEVEFRREHGYPPFARLVRFLYRHTKEREAALEAEMMARELARHARTRGVTMDLMGPAPAFAAKLRDQYQWQIVMRAHELEPLLDDLPVRPGWVVDVDPQSML